MTFFLMPSSCPPDSGTSVQPYFQLVMSFLFPHHQVLKLVWGPSIGRKEVSWLQKTFRVASLHKREQQALGEERKSPSWGWHTRKGGCHAPESGWDTVTSFITHDLRPQSRLLACGQVCISDEVSITTPLLSLQTYFSHSLLIYKGEKRH